MEDNNKVTIGIETRGFEEAAEDIELMADAIAELPAVVNVKAKDCSVHVHATNIIKKVEPEPSWAKGGVRLEPDLDEEWNPEEGEMILPKGAIKEMCMMDFLKETKKMCEERTVCQGCFLANGEEGCKLASGYPAHWEV